LLKDATWRRRSDTSIARHCGVSQPFVGKVRAELSHNGYEMPETRTVHRGDQAYDLDTSRIGAHEVTVPINGAPATAARPSHRSEPAPVSAEEKGKRRWHYMTAGLLQVIRDFAHGGGVKPLLAVWTAEERATARAQLARHREEIDRLDAAIAAIEPAVEDGDQDG
jgi:hypothetical protein